MREKMNPGAINFSVLTKNNIDIFARFITIIFVF